jgi:hypothetical protein
MLQKCNRLHKRDEAGFLSAALILGKLKAAYQYRENNKILDFWLGQDCTADRVVSSRKSVKF